MFFHFFGGGISVFGICKTIKERSQFGKPKVNFRGLSNGFPIPNAIKDGWADLTKLIICLNAIRSLYRSFFDLFFVVFYSTFDKFESIIEAM